MTIIVHCYDHSRRHDRLIGCIMGAVAQGVAVLDVGTSDGSGGPKCAGLGTALPCFRARIRARES